VAQRRRPRQAARQACGYYPVVTGKLTIDTG
jgi:hypothetical protein